MAKATTKAAAPAGDKPAKAKKPAAALAGSAAKAKSTAKAKATAKPKPKPDALATLTLDDKPAAKAKKAKAPKAKTPKSVLRQTSDAIAQLASDILADRIVPTIEQIKSIAASALGQDETKGKKAKRKGAKKP